MLTNRSHQPEWMDELPNSNPGGEDNQSPHLSALSSYRDCLYQLDKIGRFLGGDRATYWALQQLPSPPHSILDVGCGGGLFTLRLGRAFPKAKVVGTDISSQAISFAQERLNEQLPNESNTQFIVSTLESFKNSESFDVVMATLVCHHLSDEELVIFLKDACSVAQQAIILNDLHRHPLAAAGFAPLVPLFFRNRMIWHDGLLSIRRSFTRLEWVRLLHAAGIDPRCYSISWHWAFRWIVMIDVEKMKQTKRHS